jgi:hypothetical protein
MKTHEILARLRNAYGLTPKELRAVRLAAADEIEKWQDAYENLQTYAAKSGLDTTCYPVKQIKDHA